MNYRKFGKTGFSVSEVSLGTWQVGGKWGEPFSDSNADRIINQAIDSGINFIDTADVYSGGQSEAAVARVLNARTEEVYLATKCGRQISPHTAKGYTPQRLTGFVEASLKNTGRETLDLIQLHCPPTEVYRRDEIFETFDRLKEQGKIRNLGVSVEKVDEALLAMEYSNVTSVQIIFNMFRLKPAENFFREAEEKEVGIIVRVPLASGLLTGKMKENTHFGSEDHRNFNRNGEAFDKGETFSGVDYQLGLEAVDKLKEVFPSNEPLAGWALRWVLMFPEVSTVIPGASKVEQLASNSRAAQLPKLTDAQMDRVREIYDRYLRPHIHDQW